MSTHSAKLSGLLGAACLALTTSLALVPSAAATEFGIADINTPGASQAPAYPAGTDKALWAGACDLTSGSTSEGGFGAADGGIEPPATRDHCMDVGNITSPNVWEPGEEPRWRLDPVTQAGAHPDATVNFFFNRGDVPGIPASSFFPAGATKDIIVKLPKGVVAIPESVPYCPAVAAQALPPLCPPETQVGIASLGIATVIPALLNYNNQPVYNIEARDTVTAEFTIGHVVGLFNIPVTARGRTNGDYGVDTLALLIPSFRPLVGQSLTVWGVPWAAEHDEWRVDGASFNTTISPNSGDTGIGPLGHGALPEFREPYDPSWGPIKPFFVNPTECAATPLTLETEMNSWEEPGQFVGAEADAEPITGCEKLEFDPSITLRPTVDVADSPSGLDVKLTIPQNNDPPAEALGNPDLAHDPDDDTGAPAYWRTDAGLATAHLKDTTVELPEGTSFNPSAANGLRGCTQAQVGVTALKPKVTFNNDPHQCPDSSKMGTLEIVSPLLPDPLQGDVYAAPQHDNPFPGALTAIYMVAQDEERGLSVKLPGKVDLDESTGQIATSFVDNPQLPFNEFSLKFKTGPRAPLNTPATCGRYKNSSTFAPWSGGPSALIEDPFEIDRTPEGQRCADEPEDRVFVPGFQAGSTVPQAGAPTSFVLNVTRRDGDQELSGITLDLPPGLVARLAGTPYCPDAALAAIEHSRDGLDESKGSLCPKASELGLVHTLAGAGSKPLPTSGKLYLAGPWMGAPVSVAAVVPAIAGGTSDRPAFDLGNVVVRSAAHVDPATAQVKVQSAPLPYILDGVPIRVRRASVQITKPGFMLNPTSCDPMTLYGALGGAADPFDPGDDVLSLPRSHFQVGGCAALGFEPKLGIRLFGGVQRTKYQGLRAVLRARPGDANIARAAVTMPRSAFLAQEHLKNICTRVQFAAGACPPQSVYGKAAATSPLLDYPLQGNVYLRSSDNNLPDLVADLRGPAHQPIRIELVGRTDSVKGALRNTFDVAPDAPVDTFVLQLFGGDKGLIVNSRNICTARNRAKVNLRAHNGRRSLTRPAVGNRKCKKFKRKAAKKRRAAKRRN